MHMWKVWVKHGPLSRNTGLSKLLRIGITFARSSPSTPPSMFCFCLLFLFVVFVCCFCLFVFVCLCLFVVFVCLFCVCFVFLYFLIFLIQFTYLNYNRWQYEHGTSTPSLIAPETYHLDAALLARPGNDEIQLDLFLDYQTNPKIYPSFHAYFKKHQPPTLLTWGKTPQI